MQLLVMRFSLVLLSCVFFLSGCDLAKPQNKGKGKPPAAQEVPPEPAAAPQAEAPQNPPDNAPAPNAAEDSAVTVKAEVGVGSKGSSYAKPTGGPMDFITVPVSAGFRARERISFMLIDDALNKFKALSEDGQGPASHEEFMTKIIKANNIILPQLPPGQSYLYDPADGELKVRQPKTAP